VLLVLCCWSCAGRGPGSDAADGDGPDGDPPDGDADTDLEPDGDAEEQPDSGLAMITVTGLQPNHGPFTGGTTVLVRGRGLVEGLEVRFGARLVDPLDVELVDDNRVRVVSPAGDPGTVDVSVRLADGREAVLAGGFTYDAWYADPASGSVAGGTLVRLLGRGVAFQPDSGVTFDGEPAVDVAWISGDEMTCRTPPSRAGGADVEVAGGDGPLVLRDGFTYFDSADPHNGGLGGGPIEGTIDITVLDDLTRRPLADTFVILGTDAGTRFQGHTDAAGRITFSDPSLRSRQSITASHAPVEVYDESGEPLGMMTYESTTIVEFDARSVTILLLPIPPPQAGPPPPGRRGGTIEGELLFEHRGEFGPYEWDIVPEPRDESELEEGTEVKVAYVYTSVRGLWTSLPEPMIGDVVFNTPEFMGPNGYRFSLYSSSGTVAVYAVAGLGIQLNPGETPPVIEQFVPYVMGVARGVVVGPDETVGPVLVYMTRQMHRDISVVLDEPPLADEAGRPNIYRVDLFLDLGVEGMILRPETTIRTANPFVTFEFPGWVDLDGNLAGTSYGVVAGAWTTYGGTIVEQNPWSVVHHSGITDLDREVIVGGFLGVPRAVAPEPGGVVEGGHMEWEAEGTTPDFVVATLTIPGGIVPVPYWLVVLRGGVTAYDLPELPTLDPELPAYPTSDLSWQVWAMSVEEDFDFDAWSYRYLFQRYWSAYAADGWYVRLAR
jgi:hypothetical protein